MAVDLFELVEPLRREVNPPGSDLFPDSTDDNWVGSLTDAFWEIRLHSLLDGFEENAASRGGPAAFSEAIVTPIGVADDTYDDPDGYDPDSDLSRELQQLIVLWAGWKIMLARMSSLNSLNRAKAGPVEYETQQAASVLKTLLDQFKARIDFILDALANSGSSTVVFDALVERSWSQALGDTWWVR